MRPVPGICDRCGLRFKLSSLREEYVLGQKTGLYTCMACFDESHPQLNTRGVRTDDKEYVKNSRSDWAEREESRSLYGYYPYVGGNDLTSVVTIELGSVTVELGPT